MANHRVNKRWPKSTNITVLDTPCREYQGSRLPAGYGRRNGHLMHRWVWEQVHGPIPAGMDVMHRCDNPPCFRYDHLQLGTRQENVADMHAKVRQVNAQPRGEAHGSAKLSDDLVVEIRERYAAGASLPELALAFKVTPQNIRHIVRRKTWRHL